MTDEELAAIQARYSLVSRFIEDSLPDLVNEVKRLRAENATLHDIVQAVAQFNDDALWSADVGTYPCPFCREDFNRIGARHRTECPVTKARALLAAESEATGEP